MPDAIMKYHSILCSVSWRGLGVPLGTPADVVAVLREAARKTAADPVFGEAMTKSNLIVSYQDGDQFKPFMNTQSDYFKKLLPTLVIQK